MKFLAMLLIGMPFVCALCWRHGTRGKKTRLCEINRDSQEWSDGILPGIQGSREEYISSCRHSQEVLTHMPLLPPSGQVLRRVTSCQKEADHYCHCYGSALWGFRPCALLCMMTKNN